MPPKEKGIKEIVELADAVIAFAEEAKEKAKNGYTLIEIAGFYDNVTDIIKEGKDYKEMLEEGKDIDVEEAKILADKLKKLVFTIVELFINLKKK